MPLRPQIFFLIPANRSPHISSLKKQWSGKERPVVLENWQLGTVSPEGFCPSVEKGITLEWLPTTSVLALGR